MIDLLADSLLSGSIEANAAGARDGGQHEPRPGVVRVIKLYSSLMIRQNGGRVFFLLGKLFKPGFTLTQC